MNRKLSSPFFGRTLFAEHLQVFVRIRHVALARRDPVPHDSRPDHVRNEFVFFAIPRKQNRARTPATIQFANLLRFIRRQIDFVLRHTGGPQQSHRVRHFFRAQPHQQHPRVPPQVSRRSRHLEFLVKRAGINLHFRSDAALVVVQRFQIHLHPVVLVRANIFQQYRRA